MGDTVWLYSPAVSKGRTPKFHRPWKGPYRVVKVLSDVTYRIQLISPKNKQDRRSRCRLVVHFNHLKPCHLQENHQPATLPPTTEISPPQGHFAPQSEYVEDEEHEEEPWVYYEPESSPILETDKSSESTSHPQDESQQETANTPSHSHQKTLEVDQFGGPDCAETFNPQTTTRRALAPKGGNNVTNNLHTNLLIVYNLYIPIITAVFPETVHCISFCLHYLNCTFFNLYQSYLLI